MKSWNLSTKTVVAFSALITLAAGSLTCFQYWQLRSSQRQALQDRLLEIAQLAAPQIDSDYHSLIVSPQHTGTAYYQINQTKLREIHAASNDIVDIYTIRQQPGEAYKYVLDYSEKEDAAIHNVGEVVATLPPRLQSGLALEKPQVERKIIRNSQNVPVLYGYAPIKSAFNRVDGLLVLELDARPVLRRELTAQIISLGIFLGLLSVTWYVVWHLTQSIVVRPTLALNKAAQKLANGAWDETIPIEREDEFGALAHSFNEMAQQLRVSFQSLEDYSQNLELKVEERTRKLKESQQLLNLVMNNIPQSIFWKDKDNVYLGCNRSFAQVAEMEVEEIVGRTDYEMPWSRKEADFYIECDRKVMQSGKPELGIVEPISKGDGNHGWLETSKVPLYDLEGQVMGIIGIFQDITPYKEAEAAAQQASKAKSEFLANMSHELRTPLNGILGYAQILKRSENLKEKEQEGIKIIHQCGSHLLTLINDILDLSKIEARKLALNPAPVHFPVLLQSVVEMCRIKAEQKGIDFIYQSSSRLPEGVAVDEKRLRQVLINLLGNAIKFTDSGSVTLHIDVSERSSSDTSLLFQVIDTGVGIADDNLIQLFEAFEQVGDQKKQLEGTGLGLAISQRIVELMGSQIEVKSEFGKGSEFFFTLDLPLVRDWVEEWSSNDVERITGYGGENSYAILVVDDRWENRAVLSNLLSPLGFSILEAENGQGALAILKDQSPALVITDISMPVMDGFELLDYIRSDVALKDTKVIVSSASVSLADQQMALNHGGDDFLAKPVDAMALFERLANLLQLEWTYQAIEKDEALGEGSLKELVVPPHSLLEDWAELAQRGRILKLKSNLEQIGDSEPDYAEFIEPLLDLAKQFQVEAIEEKLRSYLAP